MGVGNSVVFEQKVSFEMVGFIVLEDGRAYAAANWAFRATVEAIIEEIPQSDEGTNLASWLRDDPSIQCLCDLDVRELSPTSKEIFLTATERAFRTQTERGPAGWADPTYWDGWIHRFGDLIKMIECVRNGEPPSDFNPHMNDVGPPCRLFCG